MKKYIFLIVVGLFISLPQSIWALTAQEVLEKVEDRYVGKTSKANVLMKLSDKRGKTRERKMTISRAKKDNDNRDSFIHFLAPPDIRNTTYLVNEKNRQKNKWIYLSAFKKIRKIVAQDYGLSFVSSDFTYEDMEIVRASDYTASNLKEATLDGTPVYTLVATKNDTDTSYAKLIISVAKDSWVVLKTIMYDKKHPNEVLKVMTATDIQDIQNIQTPMVTTMKNLQKGTQTVLETKRIKYDLPLTEDEFSKRNMKK